MSEWEREREKKREREFVCLCRLTVYVSVCAIYASLKSQILKRVTSSFLLPVHKVSRGQGQLLMICIAWRYKDATASAGVSACTGLGLLLERRVSCLVWRRFWGRVARCLLAHSLSRRCRRILIFLLPRRFFFLLRLSYFLHFTCLLLSSSFLVVVFFDPPFFFVISLSSFLFLHIFCFISFMYMPSFLVTANSCTTGYAFTPSKQSQLDYHSKLSQVYLLPLRPSFLSVLHHINGIAQQVAVIMIIYY